MISSKLFLLFFVSKRDIYPLGQGQAIVGPQSACAYSTSMLSQYKPQLLYIPTTLVPDTAQTTIKDESTARNNQTSYLFVPRQGTQHYL